jgi:hypothetical protein
MQIFSEFHYFALPYRDFMAQFSNFLSMCSRKSSPPTMAMNLNYQHYWQYAMFFAIHKEASESLPKLGNNKY